MNTTFSVLMSLYFKENPLFLHECFESLYLQTLPASEIVLIIDGPIGNELETVLLKWTSILPLMIFRLPTNIGLGNALNFGLKKCNYEIVARMDTDDICRPNRFEHQIYFLNKNPDISIVGSDIVEINSITKEIISNRVMKEVHNDIMIALPKSNPFNHMTVIYKKSAIIDVGGYLDLPFMEDWYLWIRLLHHNYKAANLHLILVEARTGDDMLKRRSGLQYIQSELLMSQAKIKFKTASKFQAYFIFVMRAIPRLLPISILKKIYLLQRKRQ